MKHTLQIVFALKYKVGSLNLYMIQKQNNKLMKVSDNPKVQLNGQKRTQLVEYNQCSIVDYS